MGRRVRFGNFRFLLRNACARMLAASVLPFCITACHPSQKDLAEYIPPPGKYDVNILRDTWGVPHIFGKRDADAAYGLAWAQCEDDWKNVEEGILLVRGQLASVLGREYAKFDYLVQLFRVREFVERQYESEISPELRALLEGFADGISHFAAAHRDKMPHLTLPVDPREIVMGAAFKSPFFYKLHEDLGKLFGQGSAPLIGRKGQLSALALPGEWPFQHCETIGSNAWAVAPARSVDGYTRLAINSHQPWTGPVTWYEAHVHSQEGWNMVGGTFPCAPLIFKGHDENKGWCHTINRPDLVDIYTLEINPENPHQYKFDGTWRNFERRMARINVRLWGAISWTVKRELLWTVHGPALRTPSGVYAMCFAGYGQTGQLEQWYRMNKARNLNEFLAAMQLQKLSSLNTLYADKSGNLYYAYNAQFPDRPEGFDWTGYLPGDSSNALWKGLLPFSMTPHIVNPPSGFLQSCNNSPYHTTVGEGNPRPEQYPASMGIETNLTNRARRALALYGGDEAISREEFYTYKYDKRYAEEAGVVRYIKRLLAEPLPDEPLLREGADLLRAWNQSTDKDNPAAALAMLVGENHPDRENWGEPVAVLRKATALLMERFGRLDPPWQEMMRLRHGAVDIGLGGGPDCLRALDLVLDVDGRFKAINGDCYFLMVEWDKDGKVRSEAIHQFGAATIDERSPHYVDQAPLFADEQMRPTLLTEVDIRANLQREYKPGEMAGAWYE